MASSLVSAVQIKHALWQNFAVFIFETSCSFSSLSPAHSLGKLFLFSKLPSSFGTVCTQNPPLLEGNTTKFIFSAFGFFDVKTVSSHGINCSSIIIPSFEFSIAFSTNSFASFLAISRAIKRSKYFFAIS